MPRWQNAIRGTVIKSLNGMQFKSEKHFTSIVESLLTGNEKHVGIEASPVEKVNAHVDSAVPKMSFDQMNVMAHHHDAVIYIALA